MVVNLDEEAEEYALTQLAPPGQLDEFLESQLYFGVLEDHVAVVQSKSLRAGHLEAYLNWLLKERTSLLPASARLILRDHISLPRGARLKKLQQVKKVTLRTHVTPATFAGADGGAIAAPGGGPGRGGGGALVPESRVADPAGPTLLLRRAVEGLIPAGMQSLVDSLATAQGLAVEDLEVSLEIRRRGRRPQDGGRSLLDEMAEVVRNTDDLAYELDVPGVGTIRNQQLRLQTTFSVPHQNGAVLIERLVPKLLEWLNGLVQAGEIRAPRPAAS
jgi:hypothetical protein